MREELLRKKTPAEIEKSQVELKENQFKIGYLPILKMEVINDGRNTYQKFHEAIQDATITFSMVNADSGIIKISEAPCYIKRRDIEGCSEEYLICYQWKKRDTKEKGNYIGTFNIHFNGNLSGENIE